MSEAYDPSGILGVILDQLTTNVTGDLFLTLLFVFLAAFLVFLGYGLPLEINLFILMPVLIVLMSFYGNFVLIGIVIFLLLAGIIARNFFLS